MGHSGKYKRLVSGSEKMNILKVKDIYDMVKN